MGKQVETIPMQRDQDGVVEQNEFNDILTDQVLPAGTKQGQPKAHLIMPKDSTCRSEVMHAVTRCVVDFIRNS